MDDLAQRHTDYLPMLEVSPLEDEIPANLAELSFRKD